MSDQDEISRLLAEAAAQTEAESGGTSSPDTAPETSVTGETPQTPAPTITRKHPPRLAGRNNTVLGVAWFNGSLHAATFQRQKMTHSWSCPTVVRTVAEFEAVLDEALTVLEFGGTDMFLVLENELFAHQTDDIPLFSDAALRTYLKNRILRHEQEHGAVLWVLQPLVNVRKQQSVIFHLLPRSFYDELHRVLLKRHLDLTRIMPLIVPIQHELNRIPAGKGTPVIMAVEVGASTAVVAGRVGGPLLFSRTILADLNREPGRVGVEVNRSLLYTKQHFECAASSIWLMAQNGANAATEFQAKCGAGKKIVVLPASPIDWLQTTAKVSPKQPVNLLARYLKQKQRNRFIRGGFLSVVWLGLALMISHHLQQSEAWKNEHALLTALRARESSLRADRDHLDQRNRAVQRDQAFIDHLTNDRLPPVPGRLLGFVAGLLPGNVRLIEFNVKWEPESNDWSFQFNGTIESDDETAHTLIANLQDQLMKSPLRARFNDNARLIVAVPVTPTSTVEIQRFNLEGKLLEK